MPVVKGTQIPAFHGLHDLVEVAFDNIHGEAPEIVAVSVRLAMATQKSMSSLSIPSKCNGQEDLGGTGQGQDLLRRFRPKT